MKSLRRKWKFHYDSVQKGNWPDKVWEVIEKRWPNNSTEDLAIDITEYIGQEIRGIHREITGH